MRPGEVHRATTASSPRGLRVRFTVICTSCPKAVRNSISRPTEKIAGAVAHQRRDVRLLDAEDFARLRLRQAARLHDPVDLQREPRLEQFLFRIGQTEIGEHVAAALLDANFPLAHVNSAFPDDAARLPHSVA
jgi:hypothetical protein